MTSSCNATSALLYDENDYRDDDGFQDEFDGLFDEWSAKKSNLHILWAEMFTIFTFYLVKYPSVSADYGFEIRKSAQNTRTRED